MRHRELSKTSAFKKFTSSWNDKLNGCLLRGAGLFKVLDTWATQETVVEPESLSHYILNMLSSSFLYALNDLNNYKYKNRRSAKSRISRLFCKRPDNEYFRLFRPHSLRHLHQLPTLWDPVKNCSKIVQKLLTSRGPQQSIKSAQNPAEPGTPCHHTSHAPRSSPICSNSNLTTMCPPHR